MWILFLFFGFFGFSESRTVNFNFDISCGLNSTWCYLVLFLEYDPGLFGYANYDYVLFSSRVCYPYNNPRPIKEQQNVFLNDFFDLPFTHYEIVLGLRHNCTKNGDILDFVAYDEDVRIEETEFDVSIKQDLTDQGKKFEENEGVAWSRTKFEDIQIEGFEDRVIHFKTMMIKRTKS